MTDKEYKLLKANLQGVWARIMAHEEELAAIDAEIKRLKSSDSKPDSFRT